MIEVVDGLPWTSATGTDPQTLRDTLLLAITELRSDKHPWVKHNDKFQKRGVGPYEWCLRGWQANDHRGYGWDASNALRPFVPGGDLTKWWKKGRNKKDLLDLFMKAVEV